MAARDPERTRERIVAAAIQEFSAKGLAGARVDEIAARAGVNKRMLYHYFGNKDELFRAILEYESEQRARCMARAPQPLAENLPFYYDFFCGDVDNARLLEWEALEGGDAPAIAEEERRRMLAIVVERFGDAQAHGQLADDLDPDLAFLATMALTTFPLAFPQLTRFVTGRTPTDAEFQRRWTVFLRQMAQHMSGGPHDQDAPEANATR